MMKSDRGDRERVAVEEEVVLIVVLALALLVDEGDDSQRPIRRHFQPHITTHMFD